MNSDNKMNSPASFKAKSIHYARKIYHPLGFKKGYNFALFIFTCGALMGFALARFEYFNIDGKFLPQGIAGEQYWYRSGFRRVGIIMHLAAILPAAFLVVFQFVPVIRYKAILFHRINGYLCIVLLLIGNAGAFMVIKHAVGGFPFTQAFIGVLGALTTMAIVLAYINIKALQIDQHRIWMIRAWAWAASIISLRLIMFMANDVIKNWYVYYSAIQCAEIWYTYRYYGVPESQNPTSKLYPQCTNSTSSTYVLVPTPYGSNNGPENTAALFHNTFGMAGFLAFLIHAILAELYFLLTPAESARLRMVSYERQVKAGFRKPEKGGLTATRLGDAPPWWNSPMAVGKRLSDGNDSTGRESERTLNDSLPAEHIGGNVV